ncbi:adventurous gliding motility protein GltJ [Corallococcus macrosporus]|nr:adventurous gliding motility protein GltJ [Corallococcus macrosporus]
MRFVCDSCRAQYMISDDKIGPKGVKVRCKKCGHTITVRPAGATAAKDSATESSTSEAAASADPGKGGDTPAAAMPATLGTPPEGGLFTDVEEDEIGAVFDQVLSSGTQKISTDAENEAAAREASAENVRKLAEAEAEPDKEEAKANAAAHEWYVAIDEKQVGPFNVDKVKDLWDRGEVGPDSLCWRSGFSDWIPLSETAELASVLAPRPSKPVIVAPEPVSGSTPTVSSGPVQSAFSAGKGARGDSGPASASEEPVGWKPSAASVLASLVKEENDALSKPPPTPAPALGREPVSQSRLLDVPMPPPEPVSSPSLRGADVAMAPPMAAPMPYGQQPVPQQYAQPAPMPYGQQPVPQYAQPMPAPYPPQPNYPASYPPPGAGQGGGRGKTGLFVGLAAGLLLVGGGAAAFFMKGGASAETAPANPPVAAAPPVATPPPAAPAQPPANTAPVVAQAPANPATPPANTPPTEVAAAPGSTPPATPTPPANTPPTTVATAPPAETPKPAETVVAKVERPSSRRSSYSSRRQDPEPRASAPARNERPSSSDSDDDFDELFGTKKSSPASSKPSSARPTAYVPPEPGGGVPDRLQQSDIMAVVLANKPAIVKCVNEQKKKDPSLSGKLVMRWTIQTSGKTSSVSCRTNEFRSTYMASCISGLIKSWSFPRHKRQGEPIDFPFTF